MRAHDNSAPSGPPISTNMFRAVPLSTVIESITQP